MLLLYFDQINAACVHKRLFIIDQIFERMCVFSTYTYNQLYL